MSFDEIRRLPPGPGRTAAMAGWFQSLYAPGEDPAVLVGGGAVELFTGGAYTTGDLDFVGRVPPSVTQRLLGAGFEKVGRHWVQRAAEVWIEIPGLHVGADERVVELEVGEAVIRVISPEDLVVDRLAAWKFWRSEIDGLNAYRLWKAQAGSLDRARLKERARTEQVEDVLIELQAFAAGHPGAAPTEEETVRWARRDR